MKSCCIRLKRKIHLICSVNLLYVAFFHQKLVVARGCGSPVGSLWLSELSNKQQQLLRRRASAHAAFGYKPRGEEWVLAATSSIVNIANYTQPTCYIWLCTVKQVCSKATAAIETAFLVYDCVICLHKLSSPIVFEATIMVMITMDDGDHSR